jgi:simple sugar transport system permease protein
MIDLIQVFDSMLRLAVPLLFAAIAGLYAERSGLIDIGLEGKMLFGAFAAGAIAFVTGNPWLGLLAAMLIGAVTALAQGFMSISLRGNQLVIGLAINILASGLTAFLGIAWFRRGGQTPQLAETERFSPLQLPYTQEIANVPLIGRVYDQLLSGHTVLGYAVFAAVLLTWLVINRTRYGLRLTATGENPEAVDTAGISVERTRYSAILMSGLLCGAAGAYLSMVQGGAFYRDMTAGQGYIALAAVIFGAWRPFRVMFACLLFAGADALQGRLQGVPLFGQIEVPTQLIQALPYLLTIIVLAGLFGRSDAPAFAGRPYVKGER